MSVSFRRGWLEKHDEWVELKDGASQVDLNLVAASLIITIASCPINWFNRITSCISANCIQRGIHGYRKIYFIDKSVYFPPGRTCISPAEGGPGHSNKIQSQSFVPFFAVQMTVFHPKSAKCCWNYVLELSHNHVFFHSPSFCVEFHRVKEKTPREVYFSEWLSLCN